MVIEQIYLHPRSWRISVYYTSSKTIPPQWEYQQFPNTEEIQSNHRNVFIAFPSNAGLDLILARNNIRCIRTNEQLRNTSLFVYLYLGLFPTISASSLKPLKASRFPPYSLLKMKTHSLLALLAASLVEGHYIFNRLIVNGKSIGGEYAYFRKNSNTYMPSFTDEVVNSPDMRCNKGAKPGNTATYTVAAGDKIGFKLFNNE